MTFVRSAVLAILGTLCIAYDVLLLAHRSSHRATSNPHLRNRESIRAGMAAYRIRCADCHGLDARGYRGPDLAAFIGRGATGERLFDTIRNGVPGTEMPGQHVPDNDILKIIAYLRNLTTVPAPETAVGNVENGRQIFSQRCTSCHRVSGTGRRIGPDLSRIGAMRSRAALTQEIRTPSEWVAPEFEAIRLDTKEGQQILR